MALPKSMNQNAGRRALLNRKGRRDVFTQKPIEEQGTDFEPYRTLFRELHGKDAPHPVIAGMAVCQEDGGKAEEMAHNTYPVTFCQ